MIDQEHAATADEVSGFRAYVKDWLRENAADHAIGVDGQSERGMREPVDIETSRAFIKSLHVAGLCGMTWPADAGGADRSDLDELAFREEAADYALPLGPFRIGLGTVGPTIVDYGTPEQKSTLCRAILSGEAIWCQLFSEPEAGTDLAGLRTTAVREADGFRVNGRKVWNTNAHRATMGVALVRTNPDAPKHRGITMLLLDMQAPGVTVHPLREMTGNAVFNEVVLEDVLVPYDMVLGEVDDGWAVTTRMLAHERSAVSSGVGTDGKSTDALQFDGVAQHWRTQSEGASAEQRAALIDLYVEQESLSLLRSRYAQLADEGAAGPVDQSVSKLLIGRSHITSARAAMRILGPLAVFDDESLQQAILASPALSIAGGTEEIQKNLIAERGLGLPREPDPTKGMAFRDVIALTQKKGS